MEDEDDNDIEDSNDEIRIRLPGSSWFGRTYLAKADWVEGYIRDCNGKSNGGSLQIGFESSESIAGDGLLMASLYRCISP